MTPDSQFRTENCLIKLLQTKDVHLAYVKGLNDPDVNYYLDVVKREVQTIQSVIEFVKKNCESPNSVLFGIWANGNAHHCGTIRLHSIDMHHKTACIGICLFQKSEWRKGLASESIAAVTHWAINDLGLRWVEAAAYCENVASKKTFLSAGYEWMYDVKGKYLLNGIPATIKVFAATNDTKVNQETNSDTQSEKDLYGQ